MLGGRATNPARQSGHETQSRTRMTHEVKLPAKKPREPLSRDREGAVTAPERSAAPGPKVVTERTVKPRSGAGS